MRKIFCCAIVVLFLPIVAISILLFFEKMYLTTLIFGTDIWPTSAPSY